MECYGKEWIISGIANSERNKEKYIWARLGANTYELD